MIRYYCDRCGQETGDVQTIVYASKDLRHVTRDAASRGPDSDVKRGYCRDCGDLVFAAISGAIRNQLFQEETK